MNNTDKELLEIISDTSEYKGAYNIRKNGKVSKVGKKDEISKSILNAGCCKINK